MRYGYIRHKINEEAPILDTKIDQIVVDKMMNAQSLTPQWDFLRIILKNGDFLTIKCISSIGMIKDELVRFAEEMRNRGVIVYSEEEGVTLTDEGYINLLHGVNKAEKEKQAEGRAKAKENGTKFGRPLKYGVDEKVFNKEMMAYHRQEKSWAAAAKVLGMKKATFFYRYNEWKEEMGM